MRIIINGIIEDKLFYFFVIIYALIVILIAVHFDNYEWLKPAIKALYLLPIYIFIGTCITLYKLHKSMDNPSEIWTGLLLITAINIYIGLFTSLKGMMPLIAPFRYDPLLADIDKMIHGSDVWQKIKWLRGANSFIRVCYVIVWPIMYSALTMLMCLTKFPFRRQYILTLLLCWAILGNIIPLSLMAGGPVFYDRLVGGDRFAELIQQLNTMGGPSSDWPDMLWQGYISKIPGAGYGISAFPSLHVSMATLYALVGYRIHLIVGLILTLYLSLIAVSSVYLGWHYAVDGYVSFFATIAIWKICGLKQAKLPVFATDTA